MYCFFHWQGLNILHQISNNYFVRFSLVAKSEREIFFFLFFFLFYFYWSDKKTGVRNDSSFLLSLAQRTALFASFITLCPHPDSMCHLLPATILTDKFVLVAQSCPTFCDSMAPPGKNTGVDCHSLLQRIFPTQELNLGLPHCRQILCWLNYQGSLIFTRENWCIYQNVINAFWVWNSPIR